MKRRQRVIDSPAAQAAEGQIEAHLQRVYPMLRRTTIHRDLLYVEAVRFLGAHPDTAQPFLGDYIGERQTENAGVWVDDELDALLRTAHDRLTAALGDIGANILAIHPNSDYNGKFILYVAARAYADALVGEGEGT